MFIHEAIMATNEEKPNIQRNTGEWIGAGIKVWPTNTCECCIVSSEASRKSRGWQPFKEDLLADDWVTCN